ncbi:MAG: PxKF domain-containing protein [Actinomycetota bacterium]|nr:PxKF domain-containing protein [Actinomycetota bacterium]
MDNAGNQEAKTGVTLKYDNLAPTVTDVVSPAPNGSGWNNSDVNVHFDATDDVGRSGVDVASVTPDVSVTAETAGLVVNGQADDMAGNTGYDSVTVRLDKTKPTATASIEPGPNTTKNAAGWYNGPVTAKFNCADANGANGAAASGIATCPAPVTISSDGADQGASGAATDMAGNTSALAAVSGINIDGTPPVITINGFTQSTYVLGSAPALSCSATDATSRLAGTCSGTLSGGNTPTAWAPSPTRRRRATWPATRPPRRSPTASIYRWDGFLQPINDTAHQVGAATSIFKAASTVPVKFQMKKADGTVVQLPTLPAWLTPAKGSATSAPVDESAYVDPATTGTTYRWDATSQQYIYNWARPRTRPATTGGSAPSSTTARCTT